MRSTRSRDRCPGGGRQGVVEPAGTSGASTAEAPISGGNGGRDAQRVYSPPSASHAIAGTKIPPTKAAIIRSFGTSLAMTQAPVFYGVAPAYDQWRAYSFRSMASSEL